MNRAQLVQILEDGEITHDIVLDLYDSTRKDKVEYQQEIAMLNVLVGKMEVITTLEDTVIDRLFGNIKLKDKYYE